MSSWGIREEKILDYKSECYIAKRLENTTDEWGNVFPNYAEPKKYFFNIQPVSNTSNATVFGELIPRMKVAVMPRSEYTGLFNEYDAAYLDGISPIDESFHGEKANYRVYSVQPQNAIIKVYFLKIVKGVDNYEDD